MSMQEALNDAYAPLLDLDAIYHRVGTGSATDAILRQLNGPFLLAPSDEYEAANFRVVIVGQENNGWIDKNFDYLSWISTKSLEDTLNIYRGFDIANYRYGSFSRYFAMLRDQLGKQSTGERRTAVLWTNLFKLNHKGKQSIRSTLCESMLSLQSGVFDREMTALQPDAVIFLTGPRYDFVIERLLPAVEICEIDGLPKNEIAQVHSVALPELSFRTYHPGYLNRIQKEKPYCVESILARLLPAAC